MSGLAIPKYLKRLYSLPTRSLDYDVIVVGDGIVAATLALALKRSLLSRHLKIALLHQISPLPTGEFVASNLQNRVIAITDSNVDFLKTLDVWNDSVFQGCSPFSRLQVWDAGSSGKLDFDAESLGKKNFGFIVKNHKVHSSVFRSLVPSDVHFHQVTDTENMNLTLENNKRVLSVGVDGHQCRMTARLVVGADGAKSRIRDLVGISSRGWLYHQTGIVATLSLPELPQKTAYQRFLPSGPIALLPLGQQQFSLVWSIHDKYAKHLLKFSGEIFAKAVEFAFVASVTELNKFCVLLSEGEKIAFDYISALLPHMQKKNFQCQIVDNAIAGFPLTWKHAPQYTALRTALLGDAVRTIHPLAGQGLNLGLADARSLVRLIERDITCGNDIGNQLTLESYATERIQCSLPMMAGVDILQRAFSAEHMGLPLLRGYGMNLLNHSPFAKNIFSRYALG